MAFTGNYMCSSFKKELLEAKHDFTSDTFKLALYDSSATLNATTTAYSATNEITGTGYSAGGVTLTSVAPAVSGASGITGFQDVTIATATLTARGGLIYNATLGTNAVAVLDFGRDRTATAEDFNITMPTLDALNALIRIA